MSSYKNKNGPKIFKKDGNMKTMIIGEGLAGLSAAYKLSDIDEIIIIEKESEFGGMASSYSIDDYHIEKFYHHIFSGDKELIELIKELGINDKLE